MRTHKASRMGLWMALPAMALVTACSAKQPVETVAKAELAIDHAQKNQAPEYALAELQSAQGKLTLARDAMADGDNEEARRLAEQALAEAQLAEAKADSQVAQEQMKEQVDELRREASRLGATTTTKTTVIRQRPDVVVVP
jgi:hypothetical protein